MKKAEKRYSPEEVLEQKIGEIQRRREWGRLFVEIFVFAGFLYVIFAYILGIAVVRGDSMSPALKDGEHMLFYRLDRRYYPGDILLLHMDDGTVYVKRVIAMEGDEVDLDADTGSLIINGTAVSEPYVYAKTYAASDKVQFPLRVGEGQVFVLGDNREASRDSRDFGCVDISHITGRVLFHAGIF